LAPGNTSTKSRRESIWSSRSDDQPTKQVSIGADSEHLDQSGEEIQVCNSVGHGVVHDRTQLSGLDSYRDAGMGRDVVIREKPVLPPNQKGQKERGKCHDYGGRAEPDVAEA
jgi:hypothetical protein